MKKMVNALYHVFLVFYYFGVIYCLSSLVRFFNLSGQYFPAAITGVLLLVTVERLISNAYGFVDSLDEKDLKKENEERIL